MRELVLKMSMSLDGFVSDLNGQNSWMFGGDPEAKDWSVASIAEAGLHVMGRRTFHHMAAHWPTSTDPFAPAMNRIPKAVFARSPMTLPAASEAAGNWAQAHVACGPLNEEIAALKAEEGKPIFAHGGACFARSLVVAGLVDRFMLMIRPVALGQGLPLFSDLSAPMPLRLVSSTVFPGGSVAQIYQPG